MSMTAALPFCKEEFDLHKSELRAERIYFDSGSDDGYKAIELFSQGEISIADLKNQLTVLEDTINGHYFFEGN